MTSSFTEKKRIRKSFAKRAAVLDVPFLLAKKIRKPLEVVIVIIGAAIAMGIGSVFGMIPIAYLTTRPKANATPPETGKP